VFDNEDHGKLPQHREVQRFVERTLTHRTVTHVAHADATSLLVFLSKRDSGAKGNLATDDTVSTKEIVLLVKDVHGATLAFGDARCLAEKFGHNKFRVRPQRQRVRVVAIGGDPLIVFGQGRHCAGGASFLTYVQVAEATDLLLSVQLPGLLLESP